MADRDGRLHAGNLVWIFGTAKTGTSWLSAMLADAPGYAQWREPNVGNLFGAPYYSRMEKKFSRDRGDQFQDWILGGHREVWISCLRSLVLEGARARFPSLGHDDHLVIKEPHGSQGAPLLVEALPESRVILLLRDPRDVVASALAARVKGSWLYEKRHSTQGGDETLGDRPPDEIVAHRARMYRRDVERAMEAYESHTGLKVLIHYEQLRAQPLSVMGDLHEALALPHDRAALAATVERHAFENQPAHRRGPGKFRRKASPGGWRDDLTSAQVQTVEAITGPLVTEHYPISISS